MTPSQRKCLLAIQRLIARLGYGPSYREIAAEIGAVSKGHIAGLVRGLIERGYLRKIPNRSRALEVLTPIEERVAYFVFDAEQKVLIPFSERQSRREA